MEVVFAQMRLLVPKVPNKTEPRSYSPSYWPSLCTPLIATNRQMWFSESCDLDKLITSFMITTTLQLILDRDILDNSSSNLSVYDIFPSIIDLCKSVYLNNPKIAHANIQDDLIVQSMHLHSNNQCSHNVKVSSK